MMTYANKSGRPILPPLWTSDQKLGRLPASSFRTPQGPLVSPSPVTPKTPSPMYRVAHDGAIRRKDRALDKTSPSGDLSSPKPYTPIEGQSPLVSKLEQVSLQLTDADKRTLPKSPLADLRERKLSRARNRRQYQEDDRHMVVPDAYIIARTIRREENESTNETTTEASQASSSKSALPKPDKPNNRMTIRAFIRPKSAARQGFVIQRHLDIDEVRATVLNKSPSWVGRNPLPVPPKWSSSELSNDRRRTAAVSQSQAKQPKTTASTYEKVISDPKAVPIHLHYTVSALPAVAALLMSGHVRTGDVIYLPVPHADSWLQTVRYVYTGQGELTANMRENITYLGGRV
ncbi:hypothetical protein GGR50DRAFT_83546 [Xylaria sp. CBS 124048]|nr:hypothetical protein GGR50DRAFT_83546 [Xylaria sp. CBS 124048]